MEAFTVLSSVVVPLDRANVDTDAIIPKQFLKSIKRSGFGPNLFDAWRYLDRGEAGQDCSGRSLNPDFVLNAPRYQGAQIMLVRDNFGCGSSREHAPWALTDYGIRALIGCSFADIFFNNSFKNGLLPICLDRGVLDQLFRDCEATPGYSLTIDLAQQTITCPDGRDIAFEVDPFRRECLLNGWDDIGLTLRHADEIRAYEQQWRQQHPYFFVEPRS